MRTSSVVGVVAILLSINAFAEGTFRDIVKSRIKERLAERENSRPAPAASSDTAEKITKPGDYIFSFSHNGLNRFYKIHVPKNYNFGGKGTLLLALHGGGGDMLHQSKDRFYKQISKSEADGYVVVFPNGYSKFSTGKYATWNAGKCCADARDKNIDDVGFIRELISKVSQQLNIDSKRIYSTGMSNGGMMSYRLACEMPETFQGIAAVAGTDNTIDCNPKSPISILHIHAKDDDHVLFNGGIGSEASDKAQITDFQSVPATITKWVKFNGCNEKPARVLETSGAYCDLYSGCKNNVKVQLCVTESGGHSWPGGEKFWKRGQSNSKAISANDIMWDFFNKK